MNLKITLSNQLCVEICSLQTDEINMAVAAERGAFFSSCHYHAYLLPEVNLEGGGVGICCECLDCSDTIHSGNSSKEDPVGFQTQAWVTPN